MVVAFNRERNVKQQDKRCRYSVNGVGTDCQIKWYAFRYE